MRRKRHRGFTLVETLMASAILAMVVAALAQSVSAGQTQAAVSLQRLRGMSLAEALMEEILSKPYADPQGGATPGPDTGETTRQLYDNIDDYHNFSEAAGAIADQAGTLYPTEYQSMTRTATCSYGSMTVSGLGTALNGITVTVTVSDTHGSSWTVARFVPDPG